MSDRNEAKLTLGEIHDELAGRLHDRLKDPKVLAADMTVARQFLKDNGYTVMMKDSEPLRRLADIVPFQDEGLGIIDESKLPPVEDVG